MAVWEFNATTGSFWHDLAENVGLIFAGNNLQRLFAGIWVSVSIALLSMIFAIFLGALIGIIMTSQRRVTIVLTRLYVEFFRLMPQIVLLFLVYFDTTRVLGWDVSGYAAAVVVFTLWGSAEMADLVRGAITSIPRHQVESAYALGLSQGQTYSRVILPLAVRQLVPQTVNLTTRMIKTTPLVTLIGVVEILKVSQQIIDANRFEYPQAALWIYGVVFIIYFIICFLISAGSKFLEERWAV